MNTWFKSLVLSVLVALPLVGQKTVSAIPPMSDIEVFPVMRGPLTVAQMATLQVRPIKLEHDWTGYNWYRERNRFVFETIPAGQYVLVDTAGHVRYKASCGNRLVEQVQSAPAIGRTSAADIARLLSSLFPPTSDSQVRDKSVTESDSLPGILESNTRRLWSFLADRLKDGLWLLALLAGLLIVPLILYLLYRLWRDRNPGPATYAVQPAPVVTPVPAAQYVQQTPVPVSPPVVLPAPVQAAAPAVSGTTTRRFVNYAEGTAHEPSMIRYSGVSNVRYEEVGGVSTIRWMNV